MRDRNNRKDHDSVAHRDLDHRILDTAILGLKVLALEVLANGNLARGTLGHRDSVASEDSVASGLDRIRDRTPINEGNSVVQMGLEDRRENMVSPKDVDRKVTAQTFAVLKDVGLKDVGLRVTRRVLDHQQMPEEPLRGKIGEEWARSEDDRAFLLTERTCQIPDDLPSESLSCLVLPCSCHQTYITCKSGVTGSPFTRGLDAIMKTDCRSMRPVEFTRK